MEAELGRHDERVDEVRKEVRDKDFENRELALQFETLKGHAAFAEMTSNQVQH